MNDGLVNVSSGATANETTVSGGIVNVLNGGTAHDTVVSGGSLVIFGGGKVCGSLSIADGAFVSAYTSALFEFTLTEQTDAADPLITRYDRITNAENAIYTLTVGAYQEEGTYALAGCAAGFDQNVTLTVDSEYAGTLTVDGDAVAFGARNYSLGISDDTLELSVSLIRGDVETYHGSSLVSAADVMSGKAIGLEEGEDIMRVSEGGVVSAIAVNAYGLLLLSSGGTANGTIVNDGGIMTVSGGMAVSTTVNDSGIMEVSDGATANGVVVNSGGSMLLGEGGLLCGQVSIASGAFVSAGSAAMIDLTLAAQTTPDDPLIDNLDYIAGAGNASYTLTVAADQAAGRYVLAGNAASFNSAITVNTVSGEEVGTLTVGSLITDDTKAYRLLLEDDNALTLTIMAYQSVTNPVAGEDGSFDSVVLAGGTGTITFASSGTYNYSDGLAATNAIDVIGNGAAATTLAGGKLYMEGNAASFSDLTLDGTVFGGIAVTSGILGTTSTSLSFGNVTFAEGQRVYGGTEVSGDEYVLGAVGGITMSMENVDGSETARVFGAGKVAGDASLHVGDIDISVSCADDGVFCNYFAGADVAEGYNGTIVCGRVNTTIDGGTFTYFGNGSQLRGGASVQKDSTLTINGGTFQHFVYAGAFSMGGVATVNGDTTLTVNGGTFLTHVFGGCGANISDNGGNTLIKGTASITVNTSVNTVSFRENIYAGSMGFGNINGGTSLTFTGLGENLEFASDSYVTGNSQMYRGTAQYVGGDQTLAFDKFSGEFGANIHNGFTNVTLSDSNVSFTGESEVRLNGVSSWAIEVCSDAAELTLGKGTNSFKGDSLMLTLDSEATLDTEGWDVIAGTDDTLSGWDQFSSVTLDGEAATYAASGEWTTSALRLYRDGNTLKLATIA